MNSSRIRQWAPVGIAIHSFETSGDDRVPPISHIGWGKDLKKAAGNLKAHLISDGFFSSSYTGKMPWRDSALVLRVSVELILPEPAPLPSDREVSEILKSIEVRAGEVNSEQHQRGLFDIIDQLSSVQWESK